MSEADDLKRMFQLASSRGDKETAFAALKKLDALGNSNLKDLPLNIGPIDTGATMSEGLGSVMVGGGKAVSDMGAGLKQAYIGAKNQIEPSLQNEMESKQLFDEQQAGGKLYQKAREEHPFYTGMGEALPTIAATVGTGGSNLYSTALRDFGKGALIGAEKYGDPREKFEGAVREGVGAGIMPAAMAGSKTLYNAAKPLFGAGQNKLVGEMGNQFAGDAAGPAIERMLAGRMPANREIVEGSNPTAAELAQNSGISGWQRQRAAVNPEFDVNRQEQIAAQIKALRNISGSHESRQALRESIDEQAGNLYGEAKGKVITPSQELLDYISRAPEAVKVASRIKGYESGQPINLAGDMSGQDLHLIKGGIDDLLGRAGDGALGNTEKGALQNLKQNYLTELERQIPEYGVARQAHIEGMKPLNQQMIAAALKDKLSPALNDAGGAPLKQRAATFAQALRDSDALAADITGFKGAKYGEIMEPSQKAAIEAVNKDVARQQWLEAGSPRQSATAQNLKLNDLAQALGSRSTPASRIPGLKGLYEDADRVLQSKIDTAMLNPADPKVGLGVLMKNATPSEYQKIMAELLKQSGTGTALTTENANKTFNPNKQWE